VEEVLSVTTAKEVARTTKSESAEGTTEAGPADIAVERKGK
jgi:hypothetical protein